MYKKSGETRLEHSMATQKQSQPDKLIKAIQPLVLGKIQQSDPNIFRGRLKRKYLGTTVSITIAPRARGVWILYWGGGSGWDSFTRDVGRFRNIDASTKTVVTKFKASFDACVRDATKCPF